MWAASQEKVYGMATTTKHRAWGFVLGLDIDNVTANSSQRALDMLNKAYKFREGPILRDEVTVRPFYKSPGLALRTPITKNPDGTSVSGVPKEVIEKFLDAAWRENYLEIQLVDKGLPDVLRALRSEGVMVPVITTMGSRDHSLRRNLYDWLEKKGVPYDGVVEYDGELKFAVMGGNIMFVNGNADKVNASVEGQRFHSIVDDEHKLAIDLSATGRHGIVYDAPWNWEFAEEHMRNPQANPLITIVHNAAELYNTVSELNKALRS